MFRRVLRHVFPNVTLVAHAPLAHVSQVVRGDAAIRRTRVLLQLSRTGGRTNVLPPEKETAQLETYLQEKAMVRDFSVARAMFVKALGAVLNAKPRSFMVIDGALVPSFCWFAVPKRDINALIEHTQKSTACHLFLRSDVGSGKSSLIELLKLCNNNDVVVLSADSTCIGVADWRPMFVRMAKWKSKPEGLSVDNVEHHLEGKIVLVDECHLFFGVDLTFFTKGANRKTFTLFTSSATAHCRAQENKILLPTPALITNKKYFQLSFEHNDVKDLLEAHFEYGKLEDRVIPTFKAQMDAHTEVLWSLFGGHRLMTVMAVQKMIDASPKYPGGEAYFQACMSELQHFIAKPTSCRAMIINSHFYELPSAVTCCQLLLGNVEC